MKSLILKRVVLLSDSQKSANQFKFQKKYNLITGVDNSIGKTSLVKAILWAMGCEPYDIPASWKLLDCKVLVECDIDSVNYRFYRHQDIIKVSIDSGDYKRYSKVTGPFSEAFSEFVGFQAMLPNRPKEGEEPELVTPPPAYYFIPFYIDQKKGWVEPWNSFDKLGQFSDWKRTIIKSHTGYLIPEHFEIEEQVYEHKKKAREAEDGINRIDTALSVVDEYIPEVQFSLDENELVKITNEVKDTIKELSKDQEIILDELSKKISEKYHIEKQIDLLVEAIKELEDDYVFSVENIEGDALECPLCGIMHDNSIINKAGILADKKQLEEQYVASKENLLLIENTIANLNSNLDKIKNKISYLNKKHSMTDSKGNKIEISNIIDSLASRAVKNSVTNTKNEKMIVLDNEKKAQKELKKDQSNLLTKKNKETRRDYFLSMLESHIHDLSAEGVNMNGVKSPIDYKKLFNDGGAAESTRALLAYQFAVIDMIAKFGSEVIAPLIVDTPRQQEQNDINYASIIDVIMKKIPNNQQVFLCALDDPLVKPFKEKANVIKLDAQDKILKQSLYSKLRPEMLDAISAK